MCYCESLGMRVSGALPFIGPIISIVSLIKYESELENYNHPRRAVEYLELSNYYRITMLTSTACTLVLTIGAIAFGALGIAIALIPLCFPLVIVGTIIGIPGIGENNAIIAYLKQCEAPIVKIDREKIDEFLRIDVIWSTTFLKRVWIKDLIT